MLDEIVLITKTAATGFLEGILDRWLAQGENGRRSLSALNGLTIAVRLDPPGETVYLAPHANGLQILAESTVPPDATITGSPAAFLRLGLGRTPHALAASGEFTIDGDPTALTALRQAFTDASADWKDRVVGLIGPSMFDRLTGAASSMKSWAEGTATSVRLDVAEFLQEEVRETPSPAECETFLTAVDRLREDCDRLEARIGRLRQLSAAPDSAP